MTSSHGGWLVLDADPDDLLTSTPSGLWRSRCAVRAAPSP
jgi:hypothetical protein